MNNAEQFKRYGTYLVSNTGRVISKHGVELHHRINPKGYHMVSLNIEGKTFGAFVHRLVAELFCEGKTEKNNCVNHKDENPHNNNADNLEWCDIWYNNHYGDGSRRREAHRRMIGFCGKPITLSKDGKSISFRSMSEASRFLGSSQCRVAVSVNKGRKTIHGWRIILPDRKDVA